MRSAGGQDGAGGIGGLLARSEHTPTSYSHAYYHADGSGNVTALINESQAVVARYLYDPFGNIVASSGPLADANRYRFSSKELHPNSGLVYYGYRFYEPSLQRWINRDPIGVRGGVNLYGFVGNGPLGMLDPFGLEGGWKSIGLTYGDQVYRFDYRSPSFVLPDPDPDRRPNYLVYNMAVGWGADPLMRQTYRVFGPGQTPLCTEQSAWTSFLEQEAWRAANAFDWNNLHSTLDGIGLVDPTGAADLANAALYAGSGDLGNAFISMASTLPAGDLAKAARASGSYTILFKSGKRYHGKGGLDRAQDSARDIERIYGDRMDEIDWIPAKNWDEAYMDEAWRLRNDGGPQGYNPNGANYNLINSPGERLIQQGETNPSTLPKIRP
jgi:RHS repeat-associated protein